MRTNHQRADLVSRGEKGSGLDQQFAVEGRDRQVVGRVVGREQGHPQILEWNAIARECLGVELDADGALRLTDGVDIARSRHPLEFRLDSMRDLAEFVCTDSLVLGPECCAHDRDIVDTLGLDDRLTHADILGKPVDVGCNLVVEAHDRIGAILADLELHCQHRHPRTGDGVDMLDALQLRHDLLGR